jgi:non-canonical (house-cleaning) NTP pyrophosphatase
MTEMEKLRIAVGTTSEYKLGFLKEVLREIKIEENVELFPFKAQSKVSDQPTTEKEVKKGSINRARAALKNIKEAEIGLGIEAGYHRNKEGKYEMFCFASIVNKNKLTISCVSHKFPLTKFHQDKIESGVQLCEHVEAYYKDTNHPVKKYLGIMFDTRELFLKDALRQVLLRYIMRGEF